MTTCPQNNPTAIGMAIKPNCFRSNSCTTNPVVAENPNTPTMPTAVPTLEGPGLFEIYQSGLAFAFLLAGDFFMSAPFSFEYKQGLHLVYWRAIGSSATSSLRKVSKQTCHPTNTLSSQNSLMRSTSRAWSAWRSSFTPSREHAPRDSLERGPRALGRHGRAPHLLKDLLWKTHVRTIFKRLVPEFAK